MRMEDSTRGSTPLFGTICGCGETGRRATLRALWSIYSDGGSSPLIRIRQQLSPTEVAKRQTHQAQTLFSEGSTPSFRTIFCGRGAVWSSALVCHIRDAGSNPAARIQLRGEKRLQTGLISLFPLVQLQPPRPFFRTRRQAAQGAGLQTQYPLVQIQPCACTVADVAQQADVAGLNPVGASTGPCGFDSHHRHSCL